MRMIERRLARLCLACAVVATGCGDGAVTLTEHQGDLEATNVVADLAERAATAEILYETTYIDMGARSSRDALLSGWGDPEVDSETKEAFTWATAEAAVLELTLFSTDDRELQMESRTYHWDGAPEQRIIAVVNGREIGGGVVGSAMTVITIPVPEGVLRVGANRVELRFERTGTPADLEPGSSDERTLAAAFRWLAITSGGPEGRESTPAKAPRADGGDVVVPAGTGLRYRVAMPDEGVLDLGMTVPPAIGPTLLAKVWAARPGEAPINVLTVDPTKVEGQRTRLRINCDPDEIIEIGLAAVGNGAPSNDAVTFHMPRILSRSGGAGEIASVLLIVVDTLRADFLGVYGSDNHTPVVDGLAANGVLFAKARSHIPITGPSHSSLFTSKLPMEHGVRNNAQALGSDFVTMAETLRNGGRWTAAAISLGVLQREFGFDRGFDVYGDDFPRDWMKDAVEVTDEVLSLVDESSSQPFFLWAHYGDPHEPYAPLDQEYPRFDARVKGKSIGSFDAGGRGFWFDIHLPPGEIDLEFLPLGPSNGAIYRLDNLLFQDESITIEPLEGWEIINRRMNRTTYQSTFPASVRLGNPRESSVTTRMLISCKRLLDKPEIRRAYAREVEIVDREIGRLLEGLETRGMMDNTLVIYLSDHGEGLGDHRHIGHISQVYDSLLHVPLVFTWPGRLPEGVVIDHPVSLIDVFPTVADLLGLASPPDASGVSLVPLLRGEIMEARPIIAATYRPEAASDKRALIADGFKFIHSWKDERTWEELYDVVNDPRELKDLYRSRPETVDAMKEQLRNLLAALSEGASVEVELSEEEKAHLRALGYIH